MGKVGFDQLAVVVEGQVFPEKAVVNTGSLN